MKTALGFVNGTVGNLLVFWSLGMLTLLPGFSDVHAAAIPIIVDTDMTSDVDDDGMMSMIHKLQDDGACTLLCIGLTMPDINTPGRCDAINTYYGHPNIPIGVNKAVTLGVTSGISTTIATNFPNSIGVNGGNGCPNAITLYRHALAGQADGSVAIICVGGSPLMQQLLQSSADSFSFLTGTQLVAAKVSKLHIMSTSRNGSAEYNTLVNPSSAKYVFDNWPTPIIITDAGMCGSTFTGHGYSSRTPVTNPVRKAYEMYVGANNDNASWDIVCAWQAIMGNGSYIRQESTGKVTITTPAGTSAFTAGQSPDNQRYLWWVGDFGTSQNAQAVILEDLMMAAPGVSTPLARGLRIATVKVTRNVAGRSPCTFRINGTVLENNRAHTGIVIRASKSAGVAVPFVR